MAPMVMQRLGAALTAWEHHYTALDAASREVTAALAAVRKDACAASKELSCCHEEVALEMRKRRKLAVPEGGGRAAAAAAPVTAAAAALQGAVTNAETEFRAAAQERGSCHHPRRVEHGWQEVHRVRAAVEGVQAHTHAAPLTGGVILAAAREARNEECSALLRLMGSAHLGEQSGAYILGSLSVVALWRLRRVSRSFRRWGTEALAALPRPVVAGGSTGITGTWDAHSTTTVEALDMASLRWSLDIAVPALPVPRAHHAMCVLPGGRLMVVGGLREDAGAHVEEILQRRPGSDSWESLPRMTTARATAVTVALSDGRVLVAGGYNEGQEDLDSVEVLATDGSNWYPVAPMRMARSGAVGGLLHGGKVIVAGGFVDDAEGEPYYLAAAELWDPETNAWTELPPMTKARGGAAACVLPGGRFAVVGGWGRSFDDDDGDPIPINHDDGEMFDCARRVWTPLPAAITHGGFRDNAAMVPVAGGMVVLGGRTVNSQPSAAVELFDEESGRWLTLPHMMGEPRQAVAAVSLPVSALEKVPPTGL
jgi:hypothetical protein